MTRTYDFAQLRQSLPDSLKLAGEICARHHLSGERARIEEGSALVFRVGSQILKVFAPDDALFCQNEALFLEKLRGRLPLHTPGLTAAGDWQGFAYLVMEYLEGTPLSRAWPEMAEADRRAVIEQLGWAVRALHDLPPGLFAESPFDWEALIGQQRRALVENQRRLGLGQGWLDQLEPYLQAAPLDPCGGVRLVPLHTELMQEHIFVNRSGQGWCAAGLIDFEPAMLGQREYEFCAVGLFLTQGNRELFRAFLSGYGYADEERTGAISRKIMRLLLLHRYCNLPWFLSRVPNALQLTQLSELEQFWFGG